MAGHPAKRPARAANAKNASSLRITTKLLSGRAAPPLLIRVVQSGTNSTSTSVLAPTTYVHRRRRPQTVYRRPQEERLAHADDIDSRAARLELPFNRFGYDPYGISRKHIAWGMRFFKPLYRTYFRVRVFGAENVPARGRA